MTAKANFDGGLVHVWECDSYEAARECAQSKALVHKRLHSDEKLYTDVTIRDEHGIKCAY